MGKICSLMHNFPSPHSVPVSLHSGGDEGGLGSPMRTVHVVNKSSNGLRKEVEKIPIWEIPVERGRVILCF